ncbi:MAG: 50S ribosomal protein L24 [Omnitrophica WOR_2 bacterium RIFCSPHIGHO2_02_FULL_68_15]|nr:MAG: 50S ribosomal protein L24 [Omnitrophica WOR_2 bacterium RIFCSPHIGHO2_02_FULL_68_15]
MHKLRRDDPVHVMTGKDRGKTGKILRIFPEKGRALVEGINMVKRHVRPTQENPKGGIAAQERPIALSNLQRACPRCRRGVRVKVTVAADKTRSRVCGRCGEAL